MRVPFPIAEVQNPEHNERRLAGVTKVAPHQEECAMNRKILWTGLWAATGVVVLLGLHGAISLAAEPPAPPAMPAVAPAPAGQYQVDKSHASIQLRVSHLGFSTYTTRFSRFDADLTFDPRNIPASKVVATIDASSLE